ncbi:MAG: PKD domain-containing protein, partial [Calditrichaeota bacterium]
MKRIIVLLFAITILFSLSASANQVLNVDRDHNVPSFLGYVPDRIVVVMKDDIGKLNMSMSSSATVHIGVTEFDNISDKYAVSKIEQQFAGSETKAPALSKNYKVTFNVGELEEVMDAYRAVPAVASVEPIGIHSMYATPNDGFYDPYQWYHNQANDDDIDSPEAWDIQTGNASIILAILDSGTRYYHQDLGGVNASPTTEDAARGNMWINNAELNGTSGVDDDGNGYVDDWIGYDFISSTTQCWNGEDCSGQDNDPRDFNGHGTHTAGIVGMMTNDGYGMAGVAGGWGNGSQAEYGNGVKVMPLRMGYSYNYLGQEYGVVLMDAAAEAFYYAADNGARIASCSWGSSNSGGIAAAADYFIANGGLIFVAAGNDGTQTAGYLNSRSDCISVAATDENDGAASFTTYGTWVDISAPGTGIYSTYHDHADPNVDYWAALDGTSMACPMAAATAAMIWSQNPTWSASQVESQLYSSADNIDAELTSTYIGKMGAGRINLYNAVNTGTQCDVVADFSGTTTSGCAPLSVNFSDLSSGTNIDGWSWDFGDGGTSTAQNPSYTYNSAGTYTVTLTASSSSQSCDDVATKTGYITVSGGPTADFTGTPTSGIEPLTVDFTDQSTDATGWSWDFGDGGSSTAQNPSYTYTVAGTYSVTLTASNACGSDVFTRTNYITVDPCVAPTAGFVGSPTSGDYPLMVNFTDQSSGASSYSWDFGDGGTSTQANPSYTYTAAGTYTVTQTVTNACGSDFLTRTDYITVTTPPPPTSTKAYAQSESVALGTTSGSYLNTYTSDNSYETLTEAESTSHPRKVTSEAE